MLQISGHSDDVVCIGGDVNDEVNRSIVIGDNTRGMRIKMTYSPMPTNTACWRGSVEQLGEGIPMFPCTVGEAANGYSVMFTIDCPPGTLVMAGQRVLNTKVVTP